MNDSGLRWIDSNLLAPRSLKQQCEETCLLSAIGFSGGNDYEGSDNGHSQQIFQSNFFGQSVFELCIDST